MSSNARVPYVDYLVLEPEAHLVAQECTECGARFFGRRNGCAQCFARSFRTVKISDTGEVKAFTIVHVAAPGIPVPFVAAVVDCDGMSVAGNLVGIEPTPDKVHVGLKVRLTTRSVGTDDEGSEAIGYRFEPVG